MALKNLDVNKAAKAIEKDAGQALPGLRESLAQAKRGEFAAVHTPETIAARKRGRPVGSTKPDAKVPVKLRIDPDVLAVLRATGDGWQTRVNTILRERFAL
ncbi:MAG: BrnA antitoxin family protein [Thermomonas sp.]|uniref:BrnA antitoxin family protein n=1 Tax=Thermomonas sp. TaxID=1971895 RepID=UPI0039E6B71E